MKKSAIAIVFAVAAMAVRAALTPASLFTDHCVLQRGRNVPVWGKATPGAMVSVSFAGQVKKTKTDADGCWKSVGPHPKEIRGATPQKPCSKISFISL